MENCLITAKGRTFSKKGDQVLYGKYAGTEITVGGKDYLILKENDILAKIE